MTWNIDPEGVLGAAQAQGVLCRSGVVLTGPARHACLSSDRRPIRSNLLQSPPRDVEDRRRFADGSIGHDLAACGECRRWPTGEGRIPQMCGERFLTNTTTIAPN